MDFYSPYDLTQNVTDDFYSTLESKKWSDRKEAIDKLVGIMDKNPKLVPNDSAYHRLIDELSKIELKDSNINVAVSAAQALTRLANGLGKNFEIHAPSVIVVCLTRMKETRPVVKEPCNDCLDACYQTTTFANVIGSIKEGLNAKAPGSKVAACEFFKRCMLQIDFQTAKKSAAATKEAVECLCKLALGSDPTSRDAAMKALAAFMRAVGKPLATPLLEVVAQDKLKMIKVEEYYEEYIVEFPPQTSAPSKAEQAAPEHARPAQKQQKTAAQVAQPQVVDDEDFLTPYDLLPHITDDLYTNLQSKKWSERKEPLDNLVVIMDKNPKLQPNDSAYHQVVDEISKVLAKDSNINVVASAAQVLTRLARGLKKNFEVHAGSVMSICLVRMKESKPVVKEPCGECLDACYGTTSFANVVEPIKEALVSKAPGTKVAACDFFKRCMLNIDFPTAKKSASSTKEAVDLLCKLALGSDPMCRDVAMQALAAFMRAVGKQLALPLIQTVQADKLKMAKVEEYYEAYVQEFPPVTNAQPAAPAANNKKVVRPGDKNVKTAPAAQPVEMDENQPPTPDETPLEPTRRASPPPPQLVETPMVRQMNSAISSQFRQMSDLLSSCQSVPLESFLNLQAAVPRTGMGKKTVDSMIESQLESMQPEEADPKETLQNALKSLSRSSLIVANCAVVSLLGLAQDSMTMKLMVPEAERILVEVAGNLQECQDILAGGASSNQHKDAEDFLRNSANFLIRFLPQAGVGVSVDQGQFKKLFEPAFALWCESGIVKTESKQSMKQVCVLLCEHVSPNCTMPHLLSVSAALARKAVAEEKESAESDYKKTNSGSMFHFSVNLLTKVIEQFHDASRHAEMDFMAIHRALAPFALLVIDKVIPSTSGVRSAVSSITQRFMNQSLFMTLPTTVRLSSEFPNYSNYAMKVVNALFVRLLEPKVKGYTSDDYFRAFVWTNLQRFHTSAEFDMAIFALYTPYKLIEEGHEDSFKKAYLSSWEDCFKCSIYADVVKDVLHVFDESCKNNKDKNMRDYIFEKYTPKDMFDLYGRINEICQIIDHHPDLFAGIVTGSSHSKATREDGFKSGFLNDMRRYSNVNNSFMDTTCNDDDGGANTVCLLKGAPNGMHTPKRDDGENTIGLFNSNTIVKKSHSFVRPVVSLNKSSLDFVKQVTK